MKIKNSILLITCALFSSCTFAQCIVYACTNTLAFGAGFNYDKTYTSLESCHKKAKMKCEEAGGTACALYAQCDDTGWCAFIGGETEDEALVIFVYGQESKSDAEEKARERYTAFKGLRVDSQIITTWYAYSSTEW